MFPIIDAPIYKKFNSRILLTFMALLLPPFIVGIFIYEDISIAFLLAGLSLVGILFIIFTKPEATTVVVLFVMYANLSVVAIRVYHVPELIATSFFLLLGIPLFNYLMIRRQPIITDRVFILMITYLGILLFSATMSGQPKYSVDRIASYVLEGMVLYFLIVNVMRSASLLQQCIWALILAGALMGTLSLYQELTGSYDNDFGGLATAKESEIDTGQVDHFGKDIKRRRLAGPMGSKNRYAQIMVVLLPLALMRVWIERSWILRITAAATCIPIMSGALLTFSRGAGIAIIITLLAMVVLRIIKLWHLTLIGVVAVLFILIAIPDYVYRISTATDVVDLAEGNPDEAGNSIRGRATENLAALYLFFDHPIIGVGPGQTNLYTTEYGNAVGYRRLEGERRAHNMYFEELSDTGLIGFSSFMSIVLLAMYNLLQIHNYWKHRQPEFSYTIASILLAVIAYMATGIFLHLSYIRYYWLVIALASATFHIFSSATTGLELSQQLISAKKLRSMLPSK